MNDGAASKRLGAVLVPSSGSIPLDTSYYERVLTGAGWTQQDLYTSRDNDAESLSFAALKGDLRADVFVYLYKAGPSSGESESIDSGSWSLSRGRTSITVSIRDGAGERALLEKLKGG